jgi:hypothetical protein
MSNKFKKDDIVILNIKSKRLPKYIRDAKRACQKRTIQVVFPDSKTQHTRYYVGHNNRGEDISGYPFRAEELKLYEMKLHTRHLKKRSVKNTCNPNETPLNENLVIDKEIYLVGVTKV